jgi:hypothetical protein
MKKIVNGRKYDTDTATMVASWDNGLNYSDFRSLKEILYRKKTGEYFLHGKGGAMTQYSESDGNCSRGSQDLIPLDIDEAKKWSAEKMSVDDYESNFGEVSE